MQRFARFMYLTNKNRYTLFDNIKKIKIMKKLFLVAFIALIAPFCASAQVNVENLPSINTSVTCDTLVTPDRFTLSITIIDNKGAGKAGIDEAEKKTLVPTLKAAGVDVKKDLVISNFYSTYDKKGNTVASKNYTLTVRSVAMLNTITDKLTKEDILVTVTNAEVSNLNEITAQLRIKAIKGAKMDVSRLLEAADCSVGKLLKVSMNVRMGAVMDDGAVVTTPMLMMARKSANTLSEGVDAYRKNNISVYLTVTYEIVNR